jgi:FeS assembly SUF system regulator
MLRISKLTDYATMLMTYLAQSPNGIHSAQALAAKGRIELPTVSKILKLLAQANLLDSFRGTSGGYRLARLAKDITVAQIVEAMEGPIAMTECVHGQGQCNHELHCGTRGNWHKISFAIQTALESVTLADMLTPLKNNRAIPLHVISMHPKD